MPRRLLALILCLLLLPLVAYGANTHSTADEASERQAWWGDGMSPYLTSGCLPAVPSSSLTFAAFACNGYVRGASHDLVYVTQSAVTLTLANVNGTHWLALHRDTSTALSGWTRRSGSHYLFQQTSSRPADPTGGLVVAQVTVAGGVITAVTDLRIPASYARRGVYDPTDPLYGAVGDGTTNDSAAILACLKGAPAGATVDFQANKNYKVTGSTLVIDRRLTLKGNGSTLTHTSSKGFIINAPADISGFTFFSGLTSTLVDIALYSRQVAASAVDISGTRIHDNIFGRVSTSIWDDDSVATTPHTSGIWVYNNVWNGDYTNATPGDTYNLLDLRGWADVYILTNRFEVVNPERFMKISQSDRRVHIIGNSLKSSSGSNGKQAIDMFSDTREVVIQNNLWDLNATETRCVEEKTGDGSATTSEPSEILVTGNICKLNTTDTSAGAFAFFGSWGLASATLSRSTCEVADNLILATFSTNVNPNILVRGFTNANVHGNIVWRDTTTKPTNTYGLEVSNSRTIQILGNQIEYGIILVNGAASHPNATTYTGQPDAVVISGNTQRSYKSLAAIYVPNATVIQLTITDNILDDDGTGSGSGGFLRLENTTVSNLLMTGNQGFTQGATDIVLSTASISTTSVVLNNTWQKGSVTWNPGTVNNAASGTTNVSILGAQVGDIVTIGQPYSSQGASVEGRVSGAGNVLLTLWNSTGGNLTYASGVWNVQTSRK